MTHKLVFDGDNSGMKYYVWVYIFIYFYAGSLPIFLNTLLSLMTMGLGLDNINTIF